jgi:hypothetical protein
MKGKVIILCVWMGIILGLVPIAQADFLQVYGSPTYDPNTGNGFKGGSAHVNDSGMAVGWAIKYVRGTNVGRRPVRWNASGAMELGNLGTDSNGYTWTEACAINNAGTAVGFAGKLFHIVSKEMDFHAVRWNALGTDAMELGNLGTDGNGCTEAYAYAINNAGITVGGARKYIGGKYVGFPAVRWDATGAVTELGHLGADSNGHTEAEAVAVNASGTAVGSAGMSIGYSFKGLRAVRWDSSGTAATELGNLGADRIQISGYTACCALAINNAGTAVGYAKKYVEGNDVGQRAVRWDAHSTEATELGNLGTDSDGCTDSLAWAINGAGVAVGFAQKFVRGIDMGSRAVRWNPSGTAATELGNLGADSNSYTEGVARAVNDAGIAVGYAKKYVGGIDMGEHAALWGLDGKVVDLNDLIDPNGGWTLTTAQSISNTGWIAGVGLYNPDGPGDSEGYPRLFLIHVEAADLGRPR